MEVIFESEAEFNQENIVFEEVEERYVKRKRYSADEFNQALREIHHGMTVYAASKRFNIPESTLRLHRNGGGNEKSGRKTMLNADTEKQIADWIVKCAARGGPITKLQLLEAVCSVRKRVTGDESVETPSTAWLKKIFLRNPRISTRVATQITRSSACVSEDDIRRWFHLINGYLDQENLLHLLTDSTRWINCDETGFELNPKPGKVLAERGSRNVNFVETAHPSERVSVMYTFGADGHAYSPQLILKNCTSQVKLQEMASASVGE